MLNLTFKERRAGMRLRNSDLEAMLASATFGKFYNVEFDDVLILLKIKRQHEDIKPALQAYLDTKKELAEKYCDKDQETGKPILGPGGEYSFNDALSSAKFREQFNSLLTAEVEVNTGKVKIPGSAMNRAGKWTMVDFDILSNFIEVYDENIKKEE